MWTNENRARYNRSKLRYPSDLADAEWAIIAPLIPPAKRGGNKRTVVEREIVNGVMYILSTGCQWAALPKDLPPRRSAGRSYPVADVWLKWSPFQQSGGSPMCPDTLRGSHPGLRLGCVGRLRQKLQSCR